MKPFETDIVIVGSGIAGLYCAANISSRYRVTVITKSKINCSNSALAQGGIACAVSENDSAEKHFDDTLLASSYTAETEALKLLVVDAKYVIDDLISKGVLFDRDATQFELAREGGHSENRIFHCADQTGKSVIETLYDYVVAKPNIKIIEDAFVTDLLKEGDACSGVVVFNRYEKIFSTVQASAVVLATGGCGQVFFENTNAETATGDGYALAMVSGATLKDMEFIQFHPTALYAGNGERFLISEALRGAGAQLVLKNGEPFMHKYHTQGSLAPRDVVSRAIYQEMQLQKVDHVYLDARMISEQEILCHFPGINKKCLSVGIDMRKALIPVTPAAHFMCGGIATNSNGITSIENLFAIGENACTGVHGANRLASNSLLEGLVFSKQTAEFLNSNLHSAVVRKQLLNVESREINSVDEHLWEIEQCRKNLQQLMWQHAGIVRSTRNLEDGKLKLFDVGVTIENLFQISFPSVQLFELRNMFLTSLAILNAAIENRNSIGTHWLEEDEVLPTEVNQPLNNYQGKLREQFAD